MIRGKLALGEKWPPQGMDRPPTPGVDEDPCPNYLGPQKAKRPPRRRREA
jgi:hypothetical protein